MRLTAIASAGQIQADSFIPKLVSNLAERKYRKAAREALVRYGVRILVSLSQMLQDTTLSLNARVNIPRVMALTGEQTAVDLLFRFLESSDENLRTPAVRSLSYMRQYHSHLRFDSHVETCLTDELKKYYQVISAVHVTAQKSGPKDAYRLLSRALQERVDDHIDRIFYLLGLRYPLGDIRNAHAATRGHNPADRANAIEFLDNILSKEHKRILLPIMEGLPPDSSWKVLR